MFPTSEIYLCVCVCVSSLETLLKQDIYAVFLAYISF